MNTCEVKIGIKIPKNMRDEFYKSNDEFIEKQYKTEILIFHRYLKNKQKNGGKMKASEKFLLNLQNSLEKAKFNQKREDEKNVFGEICCRFDFDEIKEENLAEHVETMFYHKSKEAYDGRVEKINPDIVKKIQNNQEISQEQKDEMISKLNRLTLPLSETLDYIKDHIEHKVIKK